MNNQRVIWKRLANCEDQLQFCEVAFLHKNRLAEVVMKFSPLGFTISVVASEPR